jgi:hypothetical protein
MRELMHGLVESVNRPEVQARSARIHEGQVRFFWRFSFPLIVLLVALWAAADWWAFHKLNYELENAATAIVIQLVIVFGAVSMMYPKR